MTAAVTRSPGVGAVWGGCTSRWGGEQLLGVQGERGKGEPDTWPNFILQCGGRYKTRLCYNALNVVFGTENSKTAVQTVNSKTVFVF